MRSRLVIVTALNLAGGLLSASAVCLGFIACHEFDTEDVINISDIELGTVLQRQVYSARATIENRSSRALRVLDVRAGCGCTDVTVQSKTLQGRGSTDLICKVDTGRMKGPASKPITLVWQHEGDKTASHSVVRVNMTVLPDYTVDPPKIEVSQARPSEHNITIHLNQPLLNKRVVDASVSNPAFTTRIVNSAIDVTTIQVTFDPKQLDLSKPMRSAILIRLEGVAEETAVVPLVIRDN